MSNIERDLYRACHGNLQEVKRLLAAGADVNAEYHGWPPLFVASEKNRLDVVRLLLDNGANVEGTADGGQTAIFIAAAKGHDSVVDLLAFRGANIELKSTGGRTPLMTASYSGRDVVVETLVAFGAEIDAIGRYSNTALMLAVQCANISTVQLLLSLNADATKVDDNGNIALQYAWTDEMKQLLSEQEKKSVEEREQTRKEALNRIRARLAIRLMRFAQDDIIGICLAFAPLELPPYVLLWIIDELPRYHLLSHHKKIELITSVRDSIWN